MERRVLLQSGSDARKPIMWMHRILTKISRFYVTRLNKHCEVGLGLGVPQFKCTHVQRIEHLVSFGSWWPIAAKCKGNVEFLFRETATIVEICISITRFNKQPWISIDNRTDQSLYSPILRRVFRTIRVWSLTSGSVSMFYLIVKLVFDLGLMFTCWSWHSEKEIVVTRTVLAIVLPLN